MGCASAWAQRCDEVDHCWRQPSFASALEAGRAHLEAAAQALVELLALQQHTAILHLELALRAERVVRVDVSMWLGGWVGVEEWEWKGVRTWGCCAS